MERSKELKLHCGDFSTPQGDDERKPMIATFEISRESLKFTQKLGEGLFGVVWEGLLENRARVAIKCLKSKATSSDCLAEANFMKTLEHPHLLRFYGVCTKEEPMWIVTELMKESLLEFLKKDGREKLELPQLINFGAQIASGMAYFENKNYIHRGLAARNVFLTGRFTAKIADFGPARFTDLCTPKDVATFPIQWTAPEAVMSNSFSIKSDVWSFGIVLTELVTYGVVPYPGMKNAEILYLLAQGYRMPPPPGCPPPLYEIMLDCWHKDPKKRPTFETLQWKLEEFFTSDNSEYQDPSAAN